MAFTCDWKCRKCGAMSPDVPTTIKDQYCPFCGVLMNRIYTAPLVTFNGPGWTGKLCTRGGKNG